MTISTKPHAMIVDDEPLIVLEAAFILEDAGFQPLEAGSGDEARALMEQHHECVVLLFSDVDMPGSLDGFGLAHHVAREWPHVEIVIASGARHPGEGDLPDKATFLPKPFSKQTVIDHLRDKLPDHKQPEPLKRAI